MQEVQAPYFPPNVGESLISGRLQVINRSVEQCQNPITIRTYDVLDTKVSKYILVAALCSLIVCRACSVPRLRSKLLTWTFYLQNQEAPLSVVHLEYLSWPDHGVPRVTLAVRELVRILYQIPKDIGPIAVHCRFVLFVRLCFLVQSVPALLLALVFVFQGKREANLDMSEYWQCGHWKNRYFHLHQQYSEQNFAWGSKCC